MQDVLIYKYIIMQNMKDRLERAVNASKDINVKINVDYEDLWEYMKENDYSIILKLYDIIKDTDGFDGLWEVYQVIIEYYFANIYFRQSIDSSNDIDSWEARYMRLFLMKFTIWLENKWVIYDYWQKEETELHTLYTKFNRNES